MTGVNTLSGIAFDTTGGFGFRLLVSGPLQGKTAIAAIDCNGAVSFITKSAPALEGGLAVAPDGFGSFREDLIAPDELSGHIYAIAPDGSVTVVAMSGMPVGSDTGVESVAFVPPGFTHGGEAYYSDRLTPGNLHPGSDSLLRLSAANLAGAGVHDGDLVSVTEGGATMEDVRCTLACLTFAVVQTPSSSHGEGHIAFTINPLPSPSPTSPVISPSPSPAAPDHESVLILAILVVIGLAAGSALLAARGRSKRGS